MIALGAVLHLFRKRLHTLSTASLAAVAVLLILIVVWRRRRRRQSQIANLRGGTDIMSPFQRGYPSRQQSVSPAISPRVLFDKVFRGFVEKERLSSGREE